MEKSINKNTKKNIKGHRKSKSRNSQRDGQIGGGGSDWVGSYYAYYMSPAELSRYTLKYIKIGMG